MKYLPIKFTDEELTTIEQLAAVNYTPEKIAKVMEIDHHQVMGMFYNHESEFRRAYDKGKLMTEFNILNKQKELAESGNITSAQIFLKEQKRIEVENIKKQIFFSDEID